MELEDLKQAWSQYDQNLKENLKTNQELLRKMNLEKSKREMQKPLIIEIISVVISFLTVILFFGFSLRFISEVKFSIPGFTVTLLGIMYLTFAILKVNRFVKIEYYKSSIITLQKDLNKLNTLILRLRKIEVYLFPLFAISMFPILFKAMVDIDIYMNVKFFLLVVFFALGISYPVGFWITKYFYDNKIKDAKSFLDEINNFEKED